MNLFRRLFFIASMSLILCSCNKIGEGIFGDWWPNDRDDASTTSKGSTFQILQQKGNFSLFMSALEKTEYSGVVNGAGLVTVFAPTDDAFRAFLTEKYGTTDLDRIDLDELELVVSYHLIKFSYSTEDFLAFSTSATSENPKQGDGSAYRYKTYARKPIETVTDPLTQKDYLVYHKEEWLPVISSRLFTAKGSPDPKEDYEKLFPNGSWAGAGDHLYVGAAKVTEAGIPTDNGYLYVIDKVAEPMPTIYEELTAQSRGQENRLQNSYKLFARIVQTLNDYEKDDDFTKTYAEPGETISLLWSLAKSGNDYALPAIASEWAYNDESGVDLMRSMTYAVMATIPTDEVLEEWILNYFSSWRRGGIEDVVELISRMPYIHLYQIAAAHLFGERELLLPSQLSVYGLSGIYGENYEVSTDDIVEELFCSNGVIYGLNKVLVSPIFENSIVTPILQTPMDNPDYTYNWYLIAFMEQQYYRSVVGDDEYTLFVLSDDDLAINSPSYAAGELRGAKFVPDLLQGTGVMNRDAKTQRLNHSMIKGKLPAPGSIPAEAAEITDTAYLRYYKTRQEAAPLAYIYNHDGRYYTPSAGFSEGQQPQSDPINIIRTFDARNGVTYQVDRMFQEVQDMIYVGLNKLVPKWKQMAGNQNNVEGEVGIGITGTTLPTWGWSTTNDVTLDGRPWLGDYNNFSLLVFAFSDQAIDAGLANGYIPKFEPKNNALTLEERNIQKWALRDYLNYYIIDRSALGMAGFPLPGLLPDGTSTNEKYSLRMETLVPYANPADAKYLTVEWDPADPMVMTIIAQNGDKIQTTRRTYGDTGLRIMPYISRKDVIYVIDQCFNHRTMFGN